MLCYRVAALPCEMSDNFGSVTHDSVFSCHFMQYRYVNYYVVIYNYNVYDDCIVNYLLVRYSLFFCPYLVITLLVGSVNAISI